MVECIKYFFEEPSEKPLNETGPDLTCAGIFAGTQARVVLGCVTIGIALQVISGLGFLGLVPGMNSSLMRWGMTGAGILLIKLPLIIIGVARCCAKQEADKVVTQKPQAATASSTKKVEEKCKPFTEDEIAEMVQSAYGDLTAVDEQPEIDKTHEETGLNFVQLPKSLKLRIFSLIEARELAVRVAPVCQDFNALLKSSLISSTATHASSIIEASKCCKKIESPGKRLEAICQIAKASGKWYSKKTEALIKDAKEIIEQHSEELTFEQRCLLPLLEIDLCDPSDKAVCLTKKIQDLKEAVQKGQFPVIEQRDWLWGQLAIRMAAVNEKEAREILSNQIQPKSFKVKAEVELAIAVLKGESVDKALEAAAEIEDLKDKNKIYEEIVLVLAERNPYEMKTEIDSKEEELIKTVLKVIENNYSYPKIYKHLLLSEVLFPTKRVFGAWPPKAADEHILKAKKNARKQSEMGEYFNVITLFTQPPYKDIYREFKIKYLNAFGSLNTITAPQEKEIWLNKKIEELKTAKWDVDLRNWVGGQIAAKMVEISPVKARNILDQHVESHVFKAEVELLTARHTGGSFDRAVAEANKIGNDGFRKEIFTQIALALADRSPYENKEMKQAKQILKLIGAKNPETYKRLALVRAKAVINLALKEKKMSSWKQSNQQMVKSGNLPQKTLNMMECIFSALNEIGPMHTWEGLLFDIFNLFVSLDLGLATEFAKSKELKNKMIQHRMLLLLDCFQTNPEAKLAASFARTEEEQFKIFKRLLIWNPDAAKNLIPFFEDPTTQVFLWCELGCLGDKKSFEKAKEIALETYNLEIKIGLLDYIFEKQEIKSPAVEIAKLLCISKFGMSGVDLLSNIMVLHTLFKRETNHDPRQELLKKAQKFFAYFQKISDNESSLYTASQELIKEIEGRIQEEDKHQKAIQKQKKRLGLGLIEQTSHETAEDNLLIAKFRLKSNEFSIAQKAFSQIVENKNIDSITRMKALIECATAIGQSGWLDRKVG